MKNYNEYQFKLSKDEKLSILNDLILKLKIKEEVYKNIINVLDKLSELKFSYNIYNEFEEDIDNFSLFKGK